MAYTPLNPLTPEPAQDGTEVLQSIRDNLKAIRDADFIGGDSGWTYSQTGGTANEPTTQLWSKGTERIRITATFGTTGGENGNLTAATLAYSSNSGSTYDTIEARTLTYDASGNFTGGNHVLQLSKLQGLPGIVKQQLAAISAITITAGTGLTGGGNLSANRTLSFDSTWGDARYAKLAGATFTGPITVKTASHTIITPGALNVDWTAGHRQNKSVAANSTFTFTSPGSPSNLLIKVVNTSASGITITWPATVKWSSTPPLHAGLKTGIYMFWFDGTNYWGSFVQGYANA